MPRTTTSGVLSGCLTALADWFTARERTAWLDSWCRVVEARLVQPVQPFGATRLAGTLSAFALGDPCAAPDVARARDFVAGLARLQTDRVQSVDYEPGVNCADLASGRIVVDPDVVASCEFRPEATATERLDILGGLALHEAAHQAFSSADLCAKARARGNRFFSVFNLLDDEFIEMRLAEASPGYGEYVRAARRYMFGDAHRRQVRSDMSLLAAVVLFVRWPRALGAGATRRWLGPLERIRAILTPFPVTEEDVFRAAEAIFDCLNAAKGPSPSWELDEFLKKLGVRQANPESAATIGPVGAARQDGRRISDRGAPKSAMVSLPGSAGADAQVEWRVTWERPSADSAQYERDRTRVRGQAIALRQAIARSAAHKDVVTRGKRSGQLDRSKLHSLAFGNPNVFRGHDGGARGLAVVLLVDESGSMRGPKVETARRVAVLFHEALASLRDVELFIYGHSADDPVDTTNLFRYWDPRRRGPASGLGAIAARENNRDGVAIGAVLQDVVRQTRQPAIVLFALSDGHPEAHEYTGSAALEHTRRVVKGAHPIRVIHIGIDAAAGARISGEAFSFTSLPELPGQMRKLLVRELARA